MGKLNIDIDSFIPKHKYIRVYDNEEQYQKDIEARDMHECAYSLINKANTTDVVKYQPSHRETNDDDKKYLLYLTNDNIKLWAGLKIIWGYFGWEEKTYVHNGEELLGGQFYVVKPMTVLKTVPDLYQYSHLVDFLKNVNTVDTYEEQDFSSIKVASHLVNIHDYYNHKEAFVPKSYTDLDNLEIATSYLYCNSFGTLNFESDTIKLNGLKSFIGIIEYVGNVKELPVIEINNCRSVSSYFFTYENEYLRRYYNIEGEIIDEVKAFKNAHNINSIYALVELAVNNAKFDVSITDKYLSIYDEDIDNISRGIYITVARPIYININKQLKVSAGATPLTLNSSKTQDITIDNIDIYSNKFNNDKDTYTINDITCKNLTIKKFNYHIIQGVELNITCSELNADYINIYTAKNRISYIGFDITADNINIKELIGYSCKFDLPRHFSSSSIRTPSYINSKNNITINDINFNCGGEIHFIATNNIDFTNIIINNDANDSWSNSTNILIECKKFTVNNKQPISIDNTNVTLTLNTINSIILDINIKADVFKLILYKTIDIDSININKHTDNKEQSSTLTFNNCVSEKPITIYGVQQLYITFNNTDVPIIYDSNALTILHIDNNTKDFKNIIINEINNLVNLKLALSIHDYIEDNIKDKIINITPKTLETISIEYFINYPDDITEDESTFIIPTTFTKALSFSSNIKKNIIFKLDYQRQTINDNFITISLYNSKKDDGFIRDFIVYDDDNINSISAMMNLSINITNKEKSYTLKTNNNKQLYFRISINYSTLEYVDLRNAFLVNHNSHSFNINKPINLRLKHYMADINYYDMVDELDFDIVKETLLGNLDNPYLNDNSLAYYNHNPNLYNILTLNRRLYDKFTNMEKEQLLTCWKTINIRENEA